MLGKLCKATMSIIIWVIAAFLGQLARKELVVFPVKLTILVLSSHFFLYTHTAHWKNFSLMGFLRNICDSKNN